MIRLTRTAIDVADLLAGLVDPGLGGTAIFVGSVRRGSDDGAVVAIEYSAYEEMAEAELERILREGSDRWPVCRIDVRHRLGRIPTGEASIAVAAAAPHRAEAFDACRYVVEEIKKRLPIWKKEIHEDGSASWRGNDGTKGPAALA
jgi:molybdopterin synthase catalytic subunit